jgi:hypothetical protein
MDALCGIGLLVLVVSSGQALPQCADTLPRRATCLPLPAKIEVKLVDEAHLSSRTRAELQHEVERIWRRHGVAIAWTNAHASRLLSGEPFIILVVRHGGMLGARAAKMRGHSHTLGQIRFDERTAQPAPLIEISHHAVAHVISHMKYIDKPVADFATGVHEQLLGRALGRVASHEFGLWLLGPEHTSSGLMAAVLGHHLLLEGSELELPSTCRR